MKHRLVFLASVFFLLALARADAAKNIYVTQNGAGSNNGQDAADAYSLTWLNNASNWGSGASQINPGDTVHLVGTFTIPLVVAGSGASGNPVTFYFDPGANFSSPCWPAIGAIQMAYVTNIVIDGGVNPNGSLNGIIQNTANGTGLAYQNNSRGIGCNFGPAVIYNCVIKNLIVTNIYNNIPGDATRAGYGMDLEGSDITVSNCWISDGDGPLGYTGASGEFEKNIYIVNNILLNGNHLLELGAGSTANSTVSNLVVSGNLLDHTDVFDEASGSHHLDGIIVSGPDSAPLSIQMENVYIFNNVFGGHVGAHNTSSLYDGFAAPGWQWKNWYVFNNLFECFSNVWGNGFIGGVGGSNVWVVNNTFVGACPLGTVGGTNAYCYNNLCLNGTGLNLRSFTADSVSSSTAGPNSLAVLSTYFQSVWSDYNIITGSDLSFGLSLKNTNSTALWSINSGFDWNGWHTWFNNEYGWPTPIWNAIHCDPHSVTNVPAIDPNSYVPLTTDTVTVGGTNLSFLASAVPAIMLDPYGNPRPTGTTNWTIGAYEVIPSGGLTQTGPGNGSGSGSNGSSPTLTLAATTARVNNNTMVTLTWSSSNATNVVLSQIGSVGLSGSTNVPVGNTISFTATATGPGGAVSTNTSIPSPPSNFRLIPQSP